jgi:lipopolysaccharide heptosyltransferase II
MPTWESAHNLLCVRLDALGDVLMTSPAFRALKESAPERHLTLLTSHAGSGIARLIPEIDDILVYDPPWMKATPYRLGPEADQEFIGTLEKRGFDAAVIFTVYSQNPLPAAFMTYLAGIPLRLAHCRENPYQLLTHWVKEPEPENGIRHEVRRQLDLVKAIGSQTAHEGLSLRIPSESGQSAVQKLRMAGVQSERPLVVIHPGASAPSRRYPAESFAEAARGIVRDLRCQVLFTGSREEQGLIEEIRTRMAVDALTLAGCLDLAELAAVLARAQVVVCNNTGPAHISAAVGTPVVDLYALTNPQHTPWHVRHRVLFHDVPCKFCYKSVCPEGHHDCLRKVAPHEVVRATEELLAPVPVETSRPVFMEKI